MTNSNSLPAILGGDPVVSEGEPRWPICDDVTRKVFHELAVSGDWGRYDAGYCSRLIDRLKAIFECDHAALTSSGTAAIELALRGLHIGTGDEVILAAYDFKANFTNIALLGATPVLVDVRNDNGQMDISQVEAAISSQTRAILVSHLHGGLVGMKELHDLANGHQLAVIEDCCQISGQARVDGQLPGFYSDVAVLSFGGSKLLSAGRGGALLTNRADVHQRVHLYSQRGNSAYPLSEMQAAVLLPQLDQAVARQQLRVEAARTICSRKAIVDTLHPLVADRFESSDFYKLGFWYDAKPFAGLLRSRFCEAMQAEGIPLYPGFPALHQIHAKRRFRATSSLPIATSAHESMVVLHHPFLLRGPETSDAVAFAIAKLSEHAEQLRLI